MGGRSVPPCLQPGSISQEDLPRCPTRPRVVPNPAGTARAEQQHRLPVRNLHSGSAHCQELRFCRFTSKMQKHCCCLVYLWCKRLTALTVQLNPLWCTLWKLNTPYPSAPDFCICRGRIVTVQQFLFFILSNWSLQTLFQLACANCTGLEEWNLTWLEI